MHALSILRLYGPAGGSQRIVPKNQHGQQDQKRCYNKQSKAGTPIPYNGFYRKPPAFYTSKKNGFKTDGSMSVKYSAPDYTGRLCVIGSNLKEEKLAELFGL